MIKKSSRVYLEDIQTALQKIERYTADGKAAFLRDGKTQDAVIRNLSIIGEATKKLPKSIRDTSPTTPWKQIAGMRDILIHDYSATDIHIVWNTLTEDLPPLQKVITRLLQNQKKNS